MRVPSGTTAISNVTDPQKLPVSVSTLGDTDPPWGAGSP